MKLFPALSSCTNRHIPLLTLATWLLVPLVDLHAVDVPRAASKPNIIIILADDLSYWDLSCFGQTQLATPNMARLPDGCD